jgi:hypothetical protein
MRFWLGLVLQGPIWARADYAFAESWVLASWGLWLALDGLAASCGRPALLGERSDRAVWALVISSFGWTGIDYLNSYFPAWTLLGFSFNPLAREVGTGLLGAAVVPTVLAVGSLLSPEVTRPAPQKTTAAWRTVGALIIAVGWFVSQVTGGGLGLHVVGVAISVVSSPRFFAQGTGRLLSLAAGAVTWVAFDTLWSQVGPAERLFVGYSSSPILLPAVLAICAFCLVAVYDSAAEFLGKPWFDPFSRNN